MRSAPLLFWNFTFFRFGFGFGISRLVRIFICVFKALRSCARGFRYCIGRAQTRFATLRRGAHAIPVALDIGTTRRLGACSIRAASNAAAAASSLSKHVFSDELSFRQIKGNKRSRERCDD